MFKKIIAISFAAILATAALTGCGCQNSDDNESPTTSNVEPTAPKVVVSDPEAARVATLDIFLSSRSLTLNEKVLHFLVDDTQMEYVGLHIADPTGLDAIAPGETKENVKYVGDSGLTAYVTMVNNSSDTVPYTGCKYTSVRLNKGNCEDVVLHLPNKIAWNDTVDTVKKEYGEPLEESTTSNGNTKLTYGKDSSEMQIGYTLNLVFSDKGLIEFTVEFHDVK